MTVKEEPSDEPQTVQAAGGAPPVTQADSADTPRFVLTPNPEADGFPKHYASLPLPVVLLCDSEQIGGTS